MLSDVALTGSLDDAIAALTPLLRVPSLAPQAATRLLERLRCGLEDEVWWSARMMQTTKNTRYKILIESKKRV